MSPYARIALYYVSQFLPAGAMHAYAGIWLASHDLDGLQIGIIFNLPVLAIVLANVFVGRIADTARDWRGTLQVCSLAFLIFTTGLFWATDFWSILLCFSGMMISGSIAAPIGDAAALHLTSKGRGHIGTLRGLATAGYIGALFATGYAAHLFGPMSFVVLSLGLAILRMATALALPNFKTEAEATAPQSRLGFRALLKPFLFWPLASWSVIYATIQALGSFLALHLSKQGYDAATISWLMATGAFTEVLMFFVFRRFENKLDLRVFVLVAGITCVLRWLAMSASPGLPLLFLLQATHGVTYALGFVACLSFISKNTTTGEAAEVQSFFNVMQQVVAVAFATSFGALFDVFGAKTFLLSAATAAIGCAIIASAYAKRQKAAG